MIWKKKIINFLFPDNERGVSYVFGPDVCASFLKKQDMDLICRAHQVFFSNINKVH